MKLKYDDKRNAFYLQDCVGMKNVLLSIYDLIIYSLKELISAKSHIGDRKRIVVGPEKK